MRWLQTVVATTGVALAFSASPALAQVGYPMPGYPGGYPPGYPGGMPAPYPGGAMPYGAPPPAPGPAYGVPYQGGPIAPAAAYGQDPYQANPGASGQSGTPSIQDATQPYAAGAGQAGSPYGQDPGQAATGPAGQPIVPYTGGPMASGQMPGAPTAGSPMGVPPGWSPNPGAPAPGAVPGVPPLANQPGGVPMGTAAGPMAQAGPIVGPSGMSSAQAPASTLPSPPTAGGAAVDTISIVAAGDVGVTFEPTPVRYPVSRPITFVNNSTQVVQVASEDNSTFDSGPMMPGDTFNYTPTLIGSVYYRDRLHPWARGVLVSTR